MGGGGVEENARGWLGMLVSKALMEVMVPRIYDNVQCTTKRVMG
jgi:hypothetical protein